MVATATAARSGDGVQHRRSDPVRAPGRGRYQQTAVDISRRARADA